MRESRVGVDRASGSGSLLARGRADVTLVMMIDRRTLLLALSGALLRPARARAATITDGAGRTVSVPARVERVFPAGPPAAIMLYTLAPDCLIGWPRANSREEREFLLPDIGARPEVGRIT